MLKILQDLATNHQSLHPAAPTTVHSDRNELLALCGRDHFIPLFKLCTYYSFSMEHPSIPFLYRSFKFLVNVTSSWKPSSTTSSQDWDTCPSYSFPQQPVLTHLITLLNCVEIICLLRARTLTDSLFNHSQNFYWEPIMCQALFWMLRIQWWQGLCTSGAYLLVGKKAIRNTNRAMIVLKRKMKEDNEIKKGKWWLFRSGGQERPL